MWPVSVCHHVSTIGQRSAADHLVVPEPRLRVDRLADAAEQAQRREVVGCRILGSPLHAGADRGRRRVHDRHAVALDDLPPDVLVRIVRRSLVHDAGRAVGERPVDDVAVAGDPADVGRAPVDVVVRLQVEDVAVRERRPRAGTRPSCAGRPWASPSSPRCRGRTAGARRRAARARSRRRPPRAPRGTRRRAPPASRSRRRCALTTKIVSIESTSPIFSSTA